MVFTTPVFLFLFLPATLALVLAVPRRLRNLVLLVASLVFYAWGEVFYVLLMLASIALNHAFGLWIGRRVEEGICDAVHFAGWIPNVAAGLASLLVVGAGWALLAGVIGVAEAHLGALVLGGAVIGSLGAVARLVWAEN